MNKSFSIKLAVLVIAIITIASSCKKYLDVNTNPNAPAKVDISVVLPTAEIAIAQVVGYNFQVYGSMWAQHWTQNPSSSQYKAIDQYSPAAADFDNGWKTLYVDALENLTFIVNTGTSIGKTQYVACAKILQAYTFQVLTDDFGDIPFSDALKGDQGILSPKYDKQQDVYTGIIKLLNDGIALLDPNAPNAPTSNDLLLGGDMTKWLKFANTLKLRVYLRMTNISPATAQAGIASMASAQFLGSADEVRINYTSTGGNTNPLYASMVALNGTQDLVASSTAVDSMWNWYDDRLPSFYNSLSNGSYAGITQGNYNAGIAISAISIPSAATGGFSDPSSATAPVKLMTGYESLFLQAEAVMRGWMAGSDQALYQQGITANYVSYGLSDTLPPYYYAAGMQAAYPTTGSTQAKLNAIITQKWFAMNGNQGNEAWNEWRRTGYPTWLVQSLASIIGNGRFPARFYYPSSEITKNPKCPGQQLIYTKVWWAK